MNETQFWLMLILRYLHILGAITLMGGTIFMRFALAPTVAGLDERTREQLHEQVRNRWAKFVMLSAAFLLVSGIANMVLAPRYYEFATPGDKTLYNILTGVKFLLALPIFLLASFLAGRSPTAKKIQANAPLWMNVNLALAVVMVLMGGYLRFVQRTPKGDAPPELPKVAARI